jgi:hypothetical protein
VNGASARPRLGCARSSRFGARPEASSIAVRVDDDVPRWYATPKLLVSIR